MEGREDFFGGKEPGRFPACRCDAKMYGSPPQVNVDQALSDQEVDESSVAEIPRAIFVTNHACFNTVSFKIEDLSLLGLRPAGG
jgi:hypothetical protein